MTAPAARAETDAPDVPPRRRPAGPRVALLSLLLGVLAAAVAGDARRAFEAPGPLSDGAAASDRINVLLLGIDQRPGATGPTRTDTMLILTLDPAAGTGGMLSVNRDLWVTLPDGHGDGRINTAYQAGESRHRGDGPALARQAVEAMFDVPLPYYIEVNFAAVETLIDLIGGIDVTVEQAIADPTFPDNALGYEPFYLDAGPQRLDGHTALRYARTRATPGADFARARRQQQVMLAVRDRVLDQQMLPRLLPRLLVILQTLRDAVRTNLTPRQLYRLAVLAAGIERDRITAVTLDETLISKQTIAGQAVLLLNPGAAQRVRDRLYQAPAALPAAAVAR